MQATETLGTVLLAAFCGLAATVALERLLRPVPKFFRSARSWITHIGLWCCAYGLCAGLLGQPWLASGCVLVVLFIVILVNNAKMQALQEPFVFQDYEYFLDTLRYPRLYIPFFGWKKFLISALSVLLLILLAWRISFLAVMPSYQWNHVLGGAILVIAMGAVCLYIATRQPVPLSFAPQRDIRQLGFLPCLWQYGCSSRALPTAVSPFATLILPNKKKKLPHLVAVQSESFFDPRNSFPGIRSEVLTEYDLLKADARMWGKLYVPAWGANTVRTEFAFLTSIADDLLGAHRFNPYRAVARGWRVGSLALFLRASGYRTICIHPYHKNFYLRDCVLPLLGFDEFWDIGTFTDAERFGPYVSDLALAEKVLDALRTADQPVFVFAITMENHGPLHLERIRPTDAAELYTSPPQIPCDDLTIYLRHIRNAARMIGHLRVGFSNFKRPVELCWYGDHVPIMPKVYALCGTPPGDVEYVFWSNQQSGQAKFRGLASHDLSLEWWRVIAAK